MENAPKIVSIILNTNRKDDTLACIRSIEANHYPNMQILVLDNASSDGSVEEISAKFPHIRIFPLPENKGYAGNNNVGLEIAIKEDPDWIFVLNEDIIFAEDAFEQLMLSTRDKPQIGIIGPLVFHFDEPEVIQSAGGSFTKDGDSTHLGHNTKNNGQYLEPFEVSWISGCAIGVRLKALQKAGLLDERFFYYWEETDWCFRIKENGWKALLVPKAKIWHKGVQRNYLPSPNVTYYATRNRLLFYKKHKTPLRIWVLTLNDFTRTLLSWTIRPKWKSMRAHRDAKFQGIMDYLFQHWGQRQAQTVPLSPRKTTS
jgi:GT2 family glycosyltransferase